MSAIFRCLSICAAQRCDDEGPIDSARQRQSTCVADAAKHLGMPFSPEFSRSSLFEMIERLVLECERVPAVELDLFVTVSAYCAFFPAGAGARTPRTAGWDKH